MSFKGYSQILKKKTILSTKFSDRILKTDKIKTNVEQDWDYCLHLGKEIVS